MALVRLAPVLVPGLAGERRVEGLVHPFLGQAFELALELARVALVGRVFGRVAGRAAGRVAGRVAGWVAGRVAGRLPAHCPRQLRQLGSAPSSTSSCHVDNSEKK